MFSVYWGFMSNSFRQRFVYRANSFFHLISSLMWLTVLVSLWTALLGEGQVIKGTTLADMMTFVIVNMIVQSLIRNNIGFMLAQRFEDGSIAIDFIRPIRLKYYCSQSSSAKACIERCCILYQLV